MNKKYHLLFAATILSGIIYGQAPGHVPYSNPEQVELTPFNIVLSLVSKENFCEPL